MEGSKTLHELCEALRVTRRAVQGYEKAELVKPSDRNKYGHLLYDEQAQARIAQIKLYQQLGFTIKEIQKLSDAPNEVVKEAIEQQIFRLKQERVRMDEVIRKAHELLEALG